jgi:hypothetical protein
MARRTLAAIQALVVYEIREGAPLRAYRIVRSPNDEDPVFENSLRTNYELGRPPHHAELRYEVIYRGLSMDESRAGAEATARFFDGKLGDHIAEIVLRSGNGFNVAPTGRPGHLTVWGDVLKLKAAVTDILPIEGLA